MLHSDRDEVLHERAGRPVGLAVVCALGLALGLLTGGGAWAFYPPPRGMIWAPAVVMVGSAVVLIALYVMLARLVTRRAGDWLVVGYVLAMLLIVGAVATAGASRILAGQIAPTFGVPAG